MLFGNRQGQSQSCAATGVLIMCSSGSILRTHSKGDKYAQAGHYDGARIDDARYAGHCSRPFRLHWPRGRRHDRGGYRSRLQFRYSQRFQRCPAQHESWLRYRPDRRIRFGGFFDADGSSRALSGMINGLVDFGDDDSWNGYLGAGVGIASVKYKADVTDPLFGTPGSSLPDPPLTTFN